MANYETQVEPSEGTSPDSLTEMQRLRDDFGMNSGERRPVLDGGTDNRIPDLSVLDNLNIALLLLTSDLRIRQFTPPMQRLLSVCNSDIGRSLREIRPQLSLENIEPILNEVLETQDRRELEVQDQDGRWHLLRVSPYFSSDNGIEGLVVGLVDIDRLRRKADILLTKQKEALEREIELRAGKLNQAQSELHSLTAHLFTVQEEERQRVARELHDDISQRLSVLEILLHEATADEQNKFDFERIESAREQIQSLNSDVRGISHRLHPTILQDLGLPAALKAMVQEFGERENMPATYTSQNLPEKWSSDAATALYRIAQEALRNVSKHAGKTHVKVLLAGVDHHLQLRVSDFGVGFDQESDNPHYGLGMISMQERARLAC